MQLRHYTRDKIQDASIRHELSTTVYVASRLQETVTCPLNPHPLTCRRLRMPRTRTRTGRVARDVRGFLADPSWFRGAGYARWIPDHPNWMPVTGLIRAASVWSRFDWIGRGGWRARLEILTLSSPPPPLSLHRLCYSLFNRLRLVEPAIPASFDGICFERCCRYFGQDGTLVPGDLIWYIDRSPILAGGGGGGGGGDWRWFAFARWKGGDEKRGEVIS